MKRAAIGGMLLIFLSAGLGIAVLLHHLQKRSSARLQAETRLPRRSAPVQQFSSSVSSKEFRGKETNGPARSSRPSPGGKGERTAAMAPQTHGKGQGGASLEQAPTRIKNLLSDAEFRKAEDPRSANPAVIRTRTVRVDLDPLKPGKLGRGDIVELRLFDGVSFDAVIERVERPYGASIVYQGRLDDKGLGHVTVVVNENVMVANIRSPEGRLYYVHYLGEGVHEVQEIDETKLPPCGGALIPK